MNHQEVVEEDKRNKLPKNWEQRKARAQWVVDDEQAREEAKAKGEDYDRQKMLNIPADVADKVEKKKRKKNPDQGFSDFEQAAIRYVKLCHFCGLQRYMFYSLQIRTDEK